MEHYVTIFDSLFAPQGIALHRSMERHLTKYKLWVICIDEEVHSILDKLSLPNVALLRLSDLENESLLNAKKNRSIREYCWTLTPFAPKFVFESDPSIQRVTYIDADIWFRKNPNPIFKEFQESGKGVLLTDHGYSPEYDQSATVGQYCVQFMIFDRVRGEEVRDWWEKRCLEWCYDRVEDGKLGDQKYLDQFPIIFNSSIHILSNKELTLAPWNIGRFPYGNSIIYHFQGLRLLSANNVKASDLPIISPILKNIYQPYFSDLSDSISMLERIGIKVRPQSSPVSALNYLYRVSSLLKIKIKSLFPLVSIKIR